MKTEPGARLGPYEIVSRIGAGGMGEVFHARDTRLGRSVAIKVLPDELAQNSQFRQRFEREARTISQLSHPNICTLFDVGDGYIVMELLDGESLADRLTRGPLPVRDVFRYGVEIADALQRAHRAGVIHRDLKPGNVMITKSGAKLLDFGLAKSSEVIDVGGDSATQHKPLTQEGTILGTFQYMAPEQLEGLEADSRTDIFSLGALLYEMATGVRAFQGKTRTSLIAAIVEREPPAITSLQPLAPPALEHVISKCLAKDPDDRWQSAHDIAEELRWIGSAGSQAGASVAVTTQRKNRERTAWIIAAVAVVAAFIAILLQLRGSRPLKGGVMRFTIPSVGSARRVGIYGLLAISPDGNQIVYAAQNGTSTQLRRRAIDSLESSTIDGTDGARQPFFSPDGKWVGFFAHHKLMKVALSGGQPITIGTASEPRGAEWQADDTIFFCPFFYGGIERIPAAGGAAQAVSTVDRAHGERSHRWPHMLPGGKAILYSVGSGGSWDEAKIVAQRLDTGVRTVLVNGGCDGRYVPTGHLVYVRGTSLYSVPFDAGKLVVTGPPSEVARGVANHSAGGGEFAFASNGMLVSYSQGAGADEGGTVSIVNRRGEKQPQGPAQISLAGPRFSPDGTKLTGERHNETWVFDLVRGTSTRVTSGARTTAQQWSGDGTRVIYASERDGPWRPYWRAADRSDEETPIIKSSDSMTPEAMSADGRDLLVQLSRKETGADVAIVSMVDGKIRPFAESEAEEGPARYSPDGKWVVYESDESGRSEVYVRPSATAAGRWQISTSGGGNPRWATPNEIFYQNGSKLMTVAVQSEPTFSAAPPQLLLEKELSNYDVAADGRILMVEAPEGSTGPAQMNVVLNWFEEIRSRAGASQ